MKRLLLTDVIWSGEFKIISNPTFELPKFPVTNISSPILAFFLVRIVSLSDTPVTVIEIKNVSDFTMSPPTIDPPNSFTNSQKPKY